MTNNSKHQPTPVDDDDDDDDDNEKMNGDGDNDEKEDGDDEMMNKTVCSGRQFSLSRWRPVRNNYTGYYLKECSSS